MGLLTLLGIAAATAYISNKVDEEKKSKKKNNLKQLNQRKSKQRLIKNLHKQK